MKKSTKITLILVSVIVVIVVALSLFLYDKSTEVSTTEFFKNVGVYTQDDFDAEKDNDTAVSAAKSFTINGTTYYIVNKNIDKIVIETYVLKAYKGKQLLYKSSYSRKDLQDEWLIQLHNLASVEINYADPNANSIWSSLLMPAVYLILGFLVIMLFMRQVNGANNSAIDYGKTSAKVTTGVKVRFDDVAGAEEEKEELKEVVEFLKAPKKFSDLGAKIPKGVLLVGNPGTGKTLFAKAVAGEAGVAFFSISGSAFVEMFVGVGASRVRDLFNNAKKNMPCIVFIDEIDAVGRQRGAGLGGGNDEREQTLNQLLVEMDGFEANDGIIVMAATNRADILDPALLRPGRFDRQIYVNMPDVKGREAILKVHSRNKPLAPDVNFKSLSRMTAGFSGADLANLMNEAAILAARNNRKAITNVDLYEAINKVIIGPQKKSRVITESDKRITAYHESGHAILAKLLPNCDPVQEVSIIPRGPAAGYTLTRPDSDDNHVSKSKLLDDIAMTLGGRVAEELVIKDFCTGASNDINVVTSRARKMVTEWGMSDKIGPVNYGDNEQVFLGRDYQTKAGYSEEMAKIIDLEVESIVKNAHERATKLLSENRDKLDVMARVLVERETIYSEEVDMIMNGSTPDEIFAEMDHKDKQLTENPFIRMEKTFVNKNAESQDNSQNTNN